MLEQLIAALAPGAVTLLTSVIADALNQKDFTPEEYLRRRLAASAAHEAAQVAADELIKKGNGNENH